jgi:SAM-dependent methyltransferase
VILKQLQQSGFTDLTCINLVFDTSSVKDGIRFLFGDITGTNFTKNKFDAITCLSVLEHGVDPVKYFREMSRILKPGGILFTSVDYWTTPIDALGQAAYGVPIRIFDRADVNEMMTLARECDLELVDELDLNCKKKVVSWKQYNLDYTFLYFTLRKRNLRPGI